ncbi:hypothetical protein NPX13_g10801 [Xylaria arbuscula]|uniref:Xylanolytic transcriptional activator regulatory domain-containing protein n=1 Tax=Xylaria arbuscula TaxID=114810 RepID=A0A9W8N445_9PEZI|nr:hypothetical protein NPX13_g10801 [Xylaria arbuscula]
MLLIANVPCTPSTPAPPRKRRRPNQDLQQRLARCEELLSEYTTNPRSPPPDLTTRDESWRPMGRLVIDDDGTKFTDSHLWATVHREISAMREILEDDELEDGCTPSDARTPELYSSIVLSEGTDGNVEDYRPSPAHAFRLWQTFLDKVNPLTKIIHVPSVQPKLVEATTDPSSIPKNVEALLFSIYVMGVVALNERECQIQLGCGKEEAYQRFSTGCRIALMRVGILKTYDLVVLQALVLYFFSLTGRVDRHAAWILNGVTVRVAQKMGLHRDGELLGLPPFETEMRRRVWWQIILIDTVYALMSGLGQSLLPRSWDTKQPNNINDADLYPTMTTLQPRSGPTDMIYCLVCYEMGKMMMDTPHLEAIILGNETGLPDKVPSEEVEKARRRIQELDQSIAAILDNHCDPSMGPIHELAAETRYLLISKCQELICPAKEQPEAREPLILSAFSTFSLFFFLCSADRWGTEIHSSMDNLFKISVASLETDLKLYHKTQLQGQFLWFMLSQFQAEMLVYMQDPSCARRSRRTGVEGAGGSAPEDDGRRHTPKTPAYIARLRAALPSTETKQSRFDGGVDVGVDETANVGPLTSNRPAPSGLGMPWDQMLGFVDAGALDWDMFAAGGDNNAAAAAAAAAAATNAPGGYSMGFMGHQGNTWM